MNHRGCSHGGGGGGSGSRTGGFSRLRPESKWAELVHAKTPTPMWRGMKSSWNQPPSHTAAKSAQPAPPMDMSSSGPCTWQLRRTTSLMVERVYPPTIRFQTPTMAKTSATPSGRMRSPARICRAASPIQERPTRTSRTSRTTIGAPVELEAVEVAEAPEPGVGEQRGQGLPLMVGHPQLGQCPASITSLLEWGALLIGNLG